MPTKNIKRKNNARQHLTRRELLKYGLCGGMAASLPLNAWLAGCGQRFRKKPNVVLLTLDTTRADHLGCFGYGRQTSPNIDKLAEHSLLYTRAIATSSWTLPSHASLFTGKVVSSHGARMDPTGPLVLTDAIVGSKDWQIYRARSIAQNEVTLAMVLKEAGYDTGAVVGGPWMKKIFGLSKGFDFYDDSGIGSVNGRLASQVTASAVSWLDTQRDKQFFLFLNYFDPHIPYSPPEPYADAFFPKGSGLRDVSKSLEGKIALYDSEILFMDYYIGKIIGKLKANNMYDNTLIIVTADHGELLGEHGKFGHGRYLFQEEVHIPLLVKYPGIEVSPSRTDVPVLITDIFVMILDRLGIDLPPGIQGGMPPNIRHPILSETYPVPKFAPDGHWRAIFDSNLKYKFLWNSRGNHMLFDLEKDPKEKMNLDVSRKQLIASMSSALTQYLAALPPPGPAQPAQVLDEEAKKALKGLGYVK